MFWGKVIGTILGSMLLGPIGAIIGLYFGHNFDKGMAHGNFGFANPHQVQEQFFSSLFQTMGHIAKADGRVSEVEIQLARQVMHQLRLDEARKKQAIENFTKGKSADFNLDGTLRDFKQSCHSQRALMQMFIEICIASAFADGGISANERTILGNIARVFGFSEHHLQRLINSFEAQQRFHQGQSGPSYNPEQQLDDAYNVLGVKPSDTDKDVKRAYRKLMAQHHPDKLVAKGLPEEMMAVAKEKSQEIQAAWEVIRKDRGIR